MKAATNNTKIPKINPNNFHLVHLLGSDDEKFSVYQDWRCPLSLLNDVFKEWQHIHDTRGNKFKEALALNPNISSDLIFKLSQDESSPVRTASLYNPNHPHFQTKILENFHSQCLSHLFTGLKNKTLENLIRKATILSGSSLMTMTRRITSHLQYDQSDDIKDFDFYFHDKDSLIMAINILLSNFSVNSESKQFYEQLGSLTLSSNGLGYDIDQLKEHGYLTGNYTANPEWQMIITNNAITIKNDKNNQPDYQFILTVCKPNPQEIVNEFDFVHCKGFIRLDTGEVKISPEVHNSMITKRLIFKGGMNPLSALVRMNKFMSRKWRMSRLQMVKLLAFASAKIDFTDMAQLQKLLRGFYLEKGYPEILEMPENIKSLEDLMEWLDELTYKY